MSSHNIQGHRIETACICPPVPDRDRDWVAVESDYDLGRPMGVGSTEQAAIFNLLEQLSEE